MSTAELAEKLQKELSGISWEERLIALRNYVQDTPVFSSSFSYEDQAITHVIATQNLPVRVFTIDTGRLFEETHEVFQKTREKYPDLQIETYYPNAEDTQDLVARQGINGFYKAVEKRKACCFVRKVEPLGRALKGAGIWVSGLRREHSDNRGDLPVAEFDAVRNIVKLYPLIDVPVGTIKPYVHEHGIPYNKLHDKGYPSIGCAPCTRAVKEGEHPRAGRWWWEQDNAQECGLHVVDGKLVRRRNP
jgi:phosphoadenosine phosphosulfate reductase